MRGDYTYNENQVCLNPEELIIVAGICEIQYAPAGKFWCAGLDISTESAGCGYPCAVSKYRKHETKESAIKERLKDALNWFDHYKTSKHYSKVTAALKKQLESFGFVPEEKNQEIGQLSLF